MSDQKTLAKNVLSKLSVCLFDFKYDSKTPVVVSFDSYLNALLFSKSIETSVIVCWKYIHTWVEPTEDYGECPGDHDCCCECDYCPSIYNEEKTPGKYIEGKLSNRGISVFVIPSNHKYLNERNNRKFDFSYLFRNKGMHVYDSKRITLKIDNKYILMDGPYSENNVDRSWNKRVDFEFKSLHVSCSSRNINENIFNIAWEVCGSNHNLLEDIICILLMYL